MTVIKGGVNTMGKHGKCCNCFLCGLLKKVGLCKKCDDKNCPDGHCGADCCKEEKKGSVDTK
jgi:hypothetical protein